jgi:hypothetical protein
MTDLTLTAIIGIGILGILNQFWVSFYSVFLKERVEGYLNKIKSHSNKMVTSIYNQGQAQNKHFK